jgi:hypothetical protein
MLSVHLCQIVKNLLLALVSPALMLTGHNSFYLLIFAAACFSFPVFYVVLLFAKLTVSDISLFFFGILGIETQVSGMRYQFP